MLRLVRYFPVVVLLFLFISYATSAQGPTTPPAQPVPEAPTQPATPPAPARFGTTATPCVTYFSTHPVPTPDSNATGESIYSNEEFETSPRSEVIDESFPCVDVTFHIPDLIDDDYFLCTGSTDCLKEGKVDSDDVKKKEPSRPDGDSITFTVCGHGSDDLYVNEKCNVDDDVNGNIDTSNYFFGGNMYVFSLVYKGDNYHSLAIGGFYVSRSYPTVDLRPNSGLTDNGDIKVNFANDITVTLGGSFRPPLDNGEKKDKRNNYFIEMKGPGYERANCTDTIAGNSKGVTFSELNHPGKYTIAIKEQVGEGGGNYTSGRDTNGGEAIPFDKLRLSLPSCKGGFIYSLSTCTIDRDLRGLCTDFKENEDPKGEEYKAFLKDLASLNGKLGTLSFPCSDDENPVIFVPLGKCLSINTAIGNVGVKPELFVGKVFQFVLAIAGFGAIILIIYSGYLFMTSQGDKERIAGARETITSAIVGLLFIILSFIILEIIGFDILRIPGFGR